MLKIGWEVIFQDPRKCEVYGISCEGSGKQVFTSHTKASHMVKVQMLWSAKFTTT
ncbi:hypothetical protein DPMN_075559 [Dreissena polymorpha]|uniref:Uncharacterized protein n=1 Tax=Dreissena polymorpha TaxID=45954 RepID=A0A9D3YKL2_DREPO|nr:hypothetical protein DPMN_075559 [Dreissena polymorpha]